MWPKLVNNMKGKRCKTTFELRGYNSYKGNALWVLYPFVNIIVKNTNKRNDNLIVNNITLDAIKCAQYTVIVCG